MQATVKLFAQARELAGSPEITLEVPSPATVAQLREAVASAYPRLAPLLKHALFAINAQYAAEEAPLNENADIACIPPVSGG